MVSGTAHHLYYSMFMLMISIATFLDTTVKVWSKLGMLVWQNKQINE